MLNLIICGTEERSEIKSNGIDRLQWDNRKALKLSKRSRHPNRREYAELEIDRCREKFSMTYHSQDVKSTNQKK